MARRLVRGSIFKVGEKVIVEGDFSGDYLGVVIKTHKALTKPIGGLDLDGTLQTHPGVTLRVTRWEGRDLDYNMEIVAWDSETRAVV